MKHVDRTGMARLIEYSMELTGNREKMTLRLGAIGDIIKEANFWAKQEKAKLIQSSHVQKAIEKKRFRSSLVEERIQELIKKDIFWVETDGYKVGQVNGLSILQTGDHMFGKPGRITANVSIGKEGVVTIDRESKMSGNIHTKGVFERRLFIDDERIADLEAQFQCLKADRRVWITALYWIVACFIPFQKRDCVKTSFQEISNSV